MNYMALCHSKAMLPLYFSIKHCSNDPLYWPL
jgi:hypothetical protein